jgi:hypothetical protein
MSTQNTSKPRSPTSPETVPETPTDTSSEQTAGAAGPPPTTDPTEN